MQLHRKDLMREAEQDRLLHIARQGQPGLRHRLLAAVGRVLVDAGRKLQEPLATAREMCVLSDGSVVLGGAEGACCD